MPFVSKEDILGELPDEWRDSALQDTERGRTPAEVWASLQNSVEDDIAAALSPTYDLPDYEADAAAVPILRNVRSAARHLTLASLYRRRQIADEANPWAKLAADSIKHLRMLGQRDAKGPAPKSSGASNSIKVIGEPSRLTPTLNRSPRRPRGGIALAPLLWLALCVTFVIGLATYTTRQTARLMRNIAITTSLDTRTPTALACYRAVPLRLTVNLDGRLRTSADGWQSIKAQIRNNPTDLEDPLAEDVISNPSGAGPFVLEFTSAQTNQELDGAESKLFWVVIVATKDDGETLDVWHASRLCVIESGYSEVAVSPGNPVGPISRVAADARYVRPAARIVAKGDSLLTPDHGVTAVPNLVSLLLDGGLTVLPNFATSGQTVAQMVALYPDEAGTLAPEEGMDAWCIMDGGINDLNAGAAAATVYGRLASLWALAKADGLRVLAFTLHDFTDNAGVSGQRLALNALILSDPTLYDGIVRLEQIFPDGYDEELFFDRIHPNAQGRQLVAEAIYAVIPHAPEPGRKFSGRLLNPLEVLELTASHTIIRRQSADGFASQDYNTGNSTEWQTGLRGGTSFVFFRGEVRLLLDEYGNASLPTTGSTFTAGHLVVRREAGNGFATIDFNTGSATTDWQTGTRGDGSFSFFQAGQTRLQLDIYGNAFIPTVGAGLILRSPNGGLWQYTAANDGTLNRTAL